MPAAKLPLTLQGPAVGSGLWVGSMGEADYCSSELILESHIHWKLRPT